MRVRVIGKGGGEGRERGRGREGWGRWGDTERAGRDGELGRWGEGEK